MEDSVSANRRRHRRARPHDGIARCNQFAAEMLNLAPADVVGLSCSDTFIRLFGAHNAGHLQNIRNAPLSFELEAEDGRRYLVAFSPLDFTKTGPTIAAAAILGISSRTLYRKLREYETAPEVTILVTNT